MKILNPACHAAHENVSSFLTSFCKGPKVSIADRFYNCPTKMAKLKWKFDFGNNSVALFLPYVFFVSFETIMEFSTYSNSSIICFVRFNAYTWF